MIDLQSSSTAVFVQNTAAAAAATQQVTSRSSRKFLLTPETSIQQSRPATTAVAQTTAKQHLKDALQQPPQIFHSATKAEFTTKATNSYVSFHEPSLNALKIIDFVQHDYVLNCAGNTNPNYPMNVDNYDELKDTLMTIPLLRNCNVAVTHPPNLERCNLYNDWCVPNDEQYDNAGWRKTLQDSNAEMSENGSYTNFNNFTSQYSQNKKPSTMVYTSKNVRGGNSIDDKPYVYQHFNNWRLHLIAYKQNKVDAIMKPRLLQIYNNGFLNAKIDENPNDDTIVGGDSNGNTVLNERVDDANASSKKQIFPMLKPINYNMNYHGTSGTLPLHHHTMQFARKQKLLTLSVPMLNHLREHHFNPHKFPTLLLHHSGGTKRNSQLSSLLQMRDVNQIKQNEMCYDDTFLRNNSNLALINKLNSLKRPNTSTKSYTRLDSFQMGAMSPTSIKSQSKTVIEAQQQLQQQQQQYQQQQQQHTQQQQQQQQQQVKNLPKSIIFPFKLDIEDTIGMKTEKRYKILKKDQKKLNRFFMTKKENNNNQSQRNSAAVIDAVSKTTFNQIFDKTRLDSILFKNK